MKNFAVAVDGSPASLAALKWAMAAGDPTSAILACNIQDPINFHQDTHAAIVAGSIDMDLTPNPAEEITHTGPLEHAVEDLGRTYGRTVTWVPLTVTPGQSGCAEAFYQAALNRQADVLVAGRHQGSALMEGMFGSFPRWLVTHAHLPTVIVPPGPDAR